MGFNAEALRAERSQRSFGKPVLLFLNFKDVFFWILILSATLRLCVKILDSLGALVAK
jgi:hypothetical protein